MEPEKASSKHEEEDGGYQRLGEGNGKKQVKGHGMLGVRCIHSGDLLSSTVTVVNHCLLEIG